MPQTWIDELAVKPGDHILALVTDAADVALMPEYAKAGLESGDVCSVVADPAHTERLRSQLGEQGVEASELEQQQKLMFIDPLEMGSDDDGFDVDVMLARMEEFLDGAAAQGITHIRNIGSMTWLSDVATDEDGVYLCARINQLLHQRPMSGL